MYIYSYSKAKQAGERAEITQAQYTTSTADPVSPTHFIPLDKPVKLICLISWPLMSTITPHHGNCFLISLELATRILEAAGSGFIA